MEQRSAAYVLCVCVWDKKGIVLANAISLATLIQTLPVEVAFLCSSSLEGICWERQQGVSCDQEGVGLDLPTEPAMSQIPKPKHYKLDHA